MIEVNGLVKRYGEKTAVNGLTFTVRPGVVTGFLGLTERGNRPPSGRSRDWTGPPPDRRRWTASPTCCTGRRWHLAGEGRTVFVSSHLMSEMALTADHLIVIGRGELIADTSVAQLVRRASGGSVRVRSPEAARLRDLIAGPDVSVASEEAGVLTVTGVDSDRIGITAAAHGITLLELAPRQASLEDAFMELTHDTVEYTAAAAPERQLAGAGRTSR